MSIDLNNPRTFITAEEIASDFQRPTEWAERGIDCGWFPTLTQGKRKRVLRHLYIDWLRAGSTFPTTQW